MAAMRGWIVVASLLLAAICGVDACGPMDVAACAATVAKCASQCRPVKERCIKCMGNMYDKCRKCVPGADWSRDSTGLRQAGQQDWRDQFFQKLQDTSRGISFSSFDAFTLHSPDSLALFEALDADHDGVMARAELEAPDTADGDFAGDLESDNDGGNDWSGMGRRDGSGWQLHGSNSRESQHDYSYSDQPNNADSRVDNDHYELALRTKGLYDLALRAKGQPTPESLSDAGIHKMNCASDAHRYCCKIVKPACKCGNAPSGRGQCQITAWQYCCDFGKTCRC